MRDINKMRTVQMRQRIIRFNVIIHRRFYCYLLVQPIVNAKANFRYYKKKHTPNNNAIL